MNNIPELTHMSEKKKKKKRRRETRCHTEVNMEATEFYAFTR